MLPDIGEELLLDVFGLEVPERRAMLHAKDNPASQFGGERDDAFPIIR